MKRLSGAITMLALATLALSACAPAAAPSPTAPPAKPAPEKPAAQPTAAPAKPAATTAPAQPAATAAPAAKPAATAAPAAKPAAKPEDLKVPKPSGSLAFKHAYPSVLGFAHLPSVMTSDRLNADGWKVEDVFMAQSELAIESTAKGEAPLGNGASSAALLAIQKGARMTLIAERVANEWLVASKLDLKQCADLKGKRLALHSEGAVSSAMVKSWVDTTCKGTNPDYVIIAGSENRAAALISGQIDATPLELADWINVDKQQPGKFHILENFSKGLPEVATTPYYVNTEWAEKNKPVLVAWLAELLKTHRMIAANPKLLEDTTRKRIESLDPKSLPDIIKGYQALNGFDVNGGLTAKKVEGTIKFFTAAGTLAPGLAVDKAANLSYLDEALKIVGKQ